jgi:hypothetical protein
MQGDKDAIYNRHTTLNFSHSNKLLSRGIYAQAKRANQNTGHGGIILGPASTNRK